MYVKKFIYIDNHMLFFLDTAHCYVESLYDGMDFSTNVTRARFDNELSKVSYFPSSYFIIKDFFLGLKGFPMVCCTDFFFIFYDCFISEFNVGQFQVASEMLAPISELLTRCKLSTADITNVVLAGGTTKVRISKNHYQLSEMTERLV